MQWTTGIYRRRRRSLSECLDVTNIGRACSNSLKFGCRRQRRPSFSGLLTADSRIRRGLAVLVQPIEKKLERVGESAWLDIIIAVEGSFSAVEPFIIQSETLHNHLLSGRHLRSSDKEGWGERSSAFPVDLHDLPIDFR